MRHDDRDDEVANTSPRWFDPTAAPRPRGGTLPPDLARLAARRLRLVSGLAAATTLLVWGLTNLILGTFAQEFSHLFQWGPPVAQIGASVLVFGLTYAPRLPKPRLVLIGLSYEVMVSFTIVLSAYVGAFDGVPAELIKVDVVGVSHVALWMFVFTVLVPATPAHMLAALAASAMAVPLTYGGAMLAGDAPRVTAGAFFLVMVMPYAMTAAVAYIAAGAMYRLRVDALRARQMGSYRLETLLGRGGMGEVWRASHGMLARPAAVKLIRREAFGSNLAAVDAAMARFEREAQVIAELRSPHTVELYDFGAADDGSLYYVMELLEGMDLDALVRETGPQRPGRVAHIVQQTCMSLAEAHGRGLVHRDIKPSNIFLCRLGLEHDFVKVLDFGVVKAVAAPPDDVAVTQAGMLVGTPAYLAPEMARGEAVDGRADLYALGCVAYWLLTGAVVFDEPTPAAMLAAHLHQPPVPPSRRARQPIPAALDTVILTCLAKSPSDRFASAEVLRDAVLALDVGEG